MPVFPFQPCPTCGVTSTNLIAYRRGEWQVWNCTRCGKPFEIVAPKPDPIEVTYG